MCLIVHKPEGVEFPIKVIESGMRKNPDGLGFWIRDGEKPARVYRYSSGVVTTTSLEEWLSRPRVKELEVVVHFRKSTRGAVDQLNVHPLPLGVPRKWGKWWIMHNGTFSSVEPFNDEMSDTATVADIVSDLAQSLCLNGRVDSGKMWDLLHAFGLFDRQRFLLLNEKEVFFKAGRKDGKEWRDCWFSNTYAWDYWSVTHPNGYRSSYPAVKPGRVQTTLPAPSKKEGKPKADKWAKSTPPARAASPRSSVIGMANEYPHDYANWWAENFKQAEGKLEAALAARGEAAQRMMRQKNTRKLLHKLGFTFKEEEKA